MTQFRSIELEDIYSLSLDSLFDINSKHMDLYSLKLLGSDVMISSNVVKGERYPIAIKVLPSSEEYSDFEIIDSECSVIIRNSRGNPITVAGELSVDHDNQTVMFSWDTNEYDIDQYTIVMWITIKYNNVIYKMMSNTINKSLRQESILE